MHMASLLGIAVLFSGLYFIFRRRSAKAKLTVLGIIMGLNLLQHFFKCFIWPHMWGEGFTLKETAYNVCAFLVILCPFSVYGKNNTIKQFQFYVGTCAGLIAPVFPLWFVKKSLLSWEFARFWVCHTFLFLSSFLPGVWGMVKFRMRDGWKFGLCFLGMLALILLNNTVFLAILGYRGEALTEELFSRNVVWMMGPPEGENFFKDILIALCFPVFKGGEDAHYTPILWYALPVYVLLTVALYGIGALSEWLQKRAESKKNKQCR